MKKYILGFFMTAMLFGIFAVLTPANVPAQTRYVARVVDRNGRVTWVPVKSPSFYRLHRNKINMGIGTSQLIEEQLKTVNTIYYSTVAKGNINIDEFSQALFDIANQCPVAGGPRCRRCSGRCRPRSRAARSPQRRHPCRSRRC